MKKAKILQIICRSGPGGGEKHLLDLMEGMGRNLNYEIYVLAPDGINYPLYCKYAKAIFNYQAGKVFFLFNIFKAYKIIKDNDIDLIHAHLFPTNIIGVAAAWLANIPLVVNLHADIRDNPDVFFRKYLYFILDKLLHRYYSKIITVSKYMREQLVRSGYDPEKISVIYNGIKSPPKDILAKKKGGYVIGNIARLHKVKGQQYLIEAISVLKNTGYRINLWLVGDGKERKALEKKINDFGLHNEVHLWGHQDDIWPFLKAIDLFVFPSISESMGIALVEAMQLQKPIIASSVGGIPEIIQDGKNGLLIKAMDVNALVASIEELINNKKKAADLADQAKKDAEARFKMDQMIRDTEAIYAGLLRSGHENR